jgi:hypothetical protein
MPINKTPAVMKASVEGSGAALPSNSRLSMEKLNVRVGSLFGR